MSSSRVTIVSCYYPLQKSKHSLDEYMNWITNFLVNIHTPIVMFSDGPAYDFMCQIRQQANLFDRFYPIRKPFSELKFSTTEWIETWTNQVSLSSFSHLHNQELYRIWANKSFFVEEAMRANPFQSEIFTWCDAGCWRDVRVARIFGEDWPSPEKIQSNKLHILAINPIQQFLDKLVNPAIQTLEDVVVQIQTQNLAIVGGTILIGDKAAWQTWIPIFEETLNLFLKHNFFAGDDQAVIVSAALWLRKSLPNFAPVFYQAPKGNGFIAVDGVPMGDLWFAFQILFSSKIDLKLEMY